MIRAFFAIACLVIAMDFDTPAQAQSDEPMVVPAPEDITSWEMGKVSEGLQSGRITSVELVTAYGARIAAFDRKGPRLNSVIALNPQAMEIARERDAERKRGETRGPLHGIPILVKDNIETADPLPTTAGSTALLNNRNDRDAPVIARLRAAGAIILGKTNLSQWANFRSTDSISGWSSVGGQVRNPYSIDRNACGSSSGSGTAARAGFAAGALGTETNGSVICPSSMTGLVGVKPTVGLVSRTHIVPISSSQDTAGPMTRSVKGAALLLSAMAGSDPADPVTAEADAKAQDYVEALDAEALKGKRVGVLRFAVGKNPRMKTLFDSALEIIREAGAETVDIAEFEPPEGFRDQAFLVLKAEFKATLNAYLATTTEAVTTRTLKDLIAYNTAQSDRELPLFGQEIFEQSEKAPALEDDEYREAVTAIQTATRENGIERMLSENEVDLLIAPSTAPAFLIEVVHGDQYPSGTGAGWMAAIAGTPHVSVPMGLIQGLPVGLSFMGPKWSEAELLAAAFAYESRREPLPTPRFLPSLAEMPAIGAALDPDVPGNN